MHSFVVLVQNAPIPAPSGSTVPCIIINRISQQQIPENAVFSGIFACSKTVLDHNSILKHSARSGTSAPWLHYGVLRAGARRIGADVGGAGGQDGGSPAMGEYKGSDNFPPPAGFALDKRCGKGYNGRTVFLRDDEGHDFAHPAPQRGCAAG